MIEHVQNVAGVRVVVANYEADAQLAKLAKDGEVDLVYSAAQDSDFLELRASRARSLLT